MPEAKDNNSKIASIIKAGRVITRMNQARPDARKSEILYYQMLTKYFTRILHAQEHGEFIAAHTVFFPAEIIYAMDLIPMHTEATTWITALFTGESSDIVAAGIEAGLASEICTPHRGLAGAFHLKVLPRPNVVLWSNLICDNTAKSGELLMKMNNCPGYFLDHPFSDTPEEQKYLLNELKNMISFLEVQSGKKMNWDKLSEIIERTDKQIELFRDICELRKHVPSPFSPQGFLELLTIDYLFPGQPEAIEYLVTLKSELQEKINNNKGAVANERFRLMSFFVPPMYLMGFLNSISHEFGAVSVVEPFFTQWGDGRLNPDRPLESVAQKSFMIPEVRMYGPLTEKTLDMIKQYARDYQINGAIYYADVGCRHSCATVKIFKDVLNDMDIPVLTLDCDVVDPNMTSKEEIREKLERFFELLEEI
ncbi:MAG: 2-hydroxyacyl-CoA dehydratase family protein [Chloroflexi bacterium]|nr:2-hydroxyacyl-CoA dehydratase family protein [Chloroflexota bacterium]